MNTITKIPHKKDNISLQHIAISVRFGFGCIECFTTTFLHTHYWLSWVDDFLLRMRLVWKMRLVRYINKITSNEDSKHREFGQSSWFPTLPLLGLRTREGAGAPRMTAHSRGGGGGKRCWSNAPTTRSLILVPHTTLALNTDKRIRMPWSHFHEYLC